MQTNTLTTAILGALLLTGTQSVLADNAAKGNIKLDQQEQRTQSDMNQERIPAAGDMEQQKEKSQEQVQGEMDDAKGLEKQKDKAQEQMQGEMDDAKGLEKQGAKKMEQERKETGKGSEQGQSMREEHSRKWWKFWE